MYVRLVIANLALSNQIKPFAVPLQLMAFAFHMYGVLLV